MVVLWIFLFIVGIVFFYLFFAPFYFEINTLEGIYRIRFHWFASASLKVVDNVLMVEYKIAGWKKQIDPFVIEKNPKEKTIEKQKRVKKRKRKIPWKKINGIISSFKVNKCSASIDCGDQQLNGILYPIFYLIQVLSRKNIQINFVDENIVILELENSLARMSWAFINS